MIEILITIVIVAVAICILINSIKKKSKGGEIGRAHV